MLDKSEMEIALGNEEFETNDVPTGEDNTPAYRYEVPNGQFLVAEEGTPIYPELRDSSGNPLDDSTRIVVQKADRRGSAITGAEVFDGRLGQFDYEKMRTDTRYAKVLAHGVAVDEHEELHVIVNVPDGSNPIDHSNSRMTIGNPHTPEGFPVFLREKSELSPEKRRALNKISSNGGR